MRFAGIAGFRAKPLYGIGGTTRAGRNRYSEIGYNYLIGNCTADRKDPLRHKSRESADE